MGVWHKAAIALAALGGELGLTATPTDDAARLARIGELYADYRAEFPDVPDVDASTLAGELDAGETLVLVNVRTDEERAVSVIPGAVPAREIEAHPDAYRASRLVAYCTIGYRSGEWAEAERAQGLDVTNLRGSILAWTHTGRLLQGPDGPTRRVHVYGPTWDLARTDYEAVW